METREEERKRKKKIAHTKFLLFFVFFFLPSKNICLFQISLDGETAYRLHICTSCLIYSAGFWRMRKKKRVGGLDYSILQMGHFFFIIPPHPPVLYLLFFLLFFFLSFFLSVFIELAYGAFLKNMKVKISLKNCTFYVPKIVR